MIVIASAQISRERPSRRSQMEARTKDVFSLLPTGSVKSLLKGCSAVASIATGCLELLLSGGSSIETSVSLICTEATSKVVVCFSVPATD